MQLPDSQSFGAFRQASKQLAGKLDHVTSSMYQDCTTSARRFDQAYINMLHAAELKMTVVLLAAPATI